MGDGEQTATLPAALVATAGTFNVTAANPTPRLGVSTASTFA